MLRWIFRLLLPSRGLLRVTAYLVCVSLVLAAFAARAVYAHVAEGALALGRELAGLTEVTRESETVWLNGARLHHVRTATKMSVSEALDRVEALCDRDPGILTRAMDEVARRYPEELSKYAPEGSWGRAMLRNETDDQGMVLCFAGRGDEGLSGLLAALQRFTESSDLSEFGDIRYAYAQRHEDGSSRMVLFWGEGSLNVSKMFPGMGDATGSDSAVLPRPPSSRRTLSAAVEDRPYAVRVYETALSEREVQTFYDAWMAKNGWHKVAEVPEEATGAYLRDNGYQVFVTLTRLSTGRLNVALVEAGEARGSSIATVQAESP